MTGSRRLLPLQLSLYGLPLALAVQIACSQPPGGSPPPDGSTAPTTTGGSAGASSSGTSGASASGAGSLPAATRTSIETALTAYETIRARLAEDRTDGIGRSAAEIAQAADSAKDGAPAPLRPHLETLAASAATLEKEAGADLAKVRAAFGETSKALVGLLAAEPSLAVGRYVFECPMTDTYKKWVQKRPELSNPYMGTRMPSCGTGASWEP